MALHSFHPTMRFRDRIIERLFGFALPGAILFTTGFAAAQTSTADLRNEQLPQPVVVAPESVDPQLQRLSLSDFEALALQNNPTLSQASAAVAQARGQLIQVGLYPNPQLGYLRSDPSRAGESRTDGVFVGQEVVTAGKRWKSQAVEQQEVNRLSWELEAQRGRVLNDVRIRFYDALGAHEAERVAEELVKIAEGGVKTTNDLLRAKQASRVDVLQARIQLKTLRISLQDAQARHRATWTQLTNIIGIPDLFPASLEGNLNEEWPTFEWESTWQRLRATSPQLYAAQARIDQARMELQREQAQPIPNLNVQVVVERDHVQDFTTTSTLVAIPVPLFNRNQGNISLASADIAEAHAEFHRTELALRDLLAETFQRFETAQFQVNQLRREIIPDATEGLDLTTSGYRAGEISFLQLLSARQSYFQSQLAYIDALTELRKVAVELDGLLLTGGLNPAEVGTALQSQGAVGRQRGVLNQLQEGASKQSLLPTLQTSGGGP